MLNYLSVCVNYIKQKHLKITASLSNSVYANGPIVPAHENDYLSLRNLKKHQKSCLVIKKQSYS